MSLMTSMLVSEAFRACSVSIAIRVVLSFRGYSGVLRKTKITQIVFTSLFLISQDASSNADNSISPIVVRFYHVETPTCRYLPQSAFSCTVHGRTYLGNISHF
jgi:hypothetical protein